MKDLLSTSTMTMSSEEIAQLVQSRHDNVKQSIERLVERGVISQPTLEDGIKSGNGTVPKLYQVTKRDSFVIVAQLSPEFTAALVDRWQELESSIAPRSFADALQLAADQQRLIEQQQPKVEFANRISATGKDLMNIRAFVNGMVGLKEKMFIQKLLKDKLLYKDQLTGTKRPYAQFSAYFTVKTEIINNRKCHITYVTPDGYTHLVDFYGLTPA